MTQQIAGPQIRTAYAYTPNLVSYVHDLYPNNEEVARQRVQNMRDVHAKHAWVVLDPMSNWYIDDGDGMVPGFLREDRKRLEAFLRNPNRKGSLKKHIDELIPPTSVSRTSLEWLMESIGLSRTKPGTPGMSGMRGIGALGDFRHSNQFRVLTRPKQEFAQLYWGDDSMRSATYELHSFKKNDLDELAEDEAMKYSINLTTEPPRDPFGNELAHGTVIQTIDFDGGRNPFNAIDLVDFLREIYAESLRKGEFELTVIDRAFTGQIFRVEPKKREGIIIVDKDIEVRGCQGKCHVHLVFDPKAQGESPAILRVNNEAAREHLGYYKDFRGWAMTAGRVKGTIQAPSPKDSKEASKLWDTQKEIMNATQAAFLYWSNKLEEIEKEVVRFIERYEEESAKSAVQELKALANSVTAEALRRVPGFEGFKVPGFGRSRKPRGEGSVTRKHKDTITAYVRDQFDEPVDGVYLQLNCPDGRKLRQKTGSRGSVNFDEHPKGSYRLEIEVPPTATLISETGFYRIRIDSQHPDHRAHFQIQFNGEPPEPRMTGNVHVDVAPLDDEEQLYANELFAGRVVLNSRVELLRKANRRREKSLLYSIISHAVSASVAEFKYESYSPQRRTRVVLEQAANVFKTMMDVFTERRESAAKTKKRSSQKKSS